MNFKISSIRKADNEVLYFFDADVMEQYINENGGEDAFEFKGFQVVPHNAEVIDPDNWRRDVLRLMAGFGLDTKNVKTHEINGIDNPDETEEEREKRFAELNSLKSRAAVYRIKDDGTIEETGEDVEDFIKQRNKEIVEESIHKLKEKCKELGLDPEEVMGEGDEGERYNRLADRVWEEMKAKGEIKEDAVLDKLVDEEEKD